MPSPEGFTDSTDWLNTSLSALAPVEAALRCQVCKDFFTTPMITSCSHTFCSLCIRRYLSQEGRCPACRESDQEIKLRRNWSIEEAVTQFKNGREGLLKVAKSIEEASVEYSRPKKRRKIEKNVSLPERRSTRSQSRKVASQDTTNGYTIPSSQEEIQDSDEGSIYIDEPQPQPPQPPQNPEPHDGLVACPICDRRMKEAFINSHLDKCTTGNATPPSRSNTPQNQNQNQTTTSVSIPTQSIAYTQTKPTRPPDRLPTINYSMLNDNALRRKLKDLGIPNHGSKELMRRRHTEWMNLWNANCDSSRPVAKGQLLRDLEVWERTLGRQVEKGVTGTGVMGKGFDREGWRRENKSGFDDLIRRARERRGDGAVLGKGDSGGGGGKGVGGMGGEGADGGDGEENASSEPRSLEEIFQRGSSSRETADAEGPTSRFFNADGHTVASDVQMNMSLSGQPQASRDDDVIVIDGSPARPR